MSVVDYRRRLHRIPELDNQLPETVAYVRSLLEPLGCKLFSPITGSLCAWFDAGKSESVAFRADLDALPVPEETGLPYASEHPGIMHAFLHYSRMLDASYDAMQAGADFMARARNIKEGK